ncbi:MAG: MFS transporter [Actinomycetota bacterium]|nr:MFS transporter [Actinomycetota bacterium]
MRRLEATAEFHRIPPPARRIVAATACNSLGSGLVLPLLVVYLTRIVHLHLAVATACLSLISVGALAGNPLAGWTADRYGRLTSLAVHIALTTVAVSLLAASSALWSTVASTVLMGLGVGGSAAWSTFLAEAVPPSGRAAAFGLNYVVTNSGIAIGALAGGFLASVRHPWTFRALYALDAVSFAAALAIVAAGPAYRGRPAAEPGHGSDCGADAAAPAPGYRLLLTNRPLLLLAMLGALLFLGGYSQVESGLVALLYTYSRIGTAGIGVAFTVNTIVLLVMHEVRARTADGSAPWTSLSRIGLCWVGAWGLIYAATGPSGTFLPLVLLCAGLSLFAVGETFYGSAVAATVNAAVTDRVRGRSNALYNTATSLGFVIGPVLAGMVVGVEAGRVFVAVVAGTCLGASILGRHISRTMEAAAKPQKEGPSCT